LRAGKDVSYLEGARLGKLPKIPGPGTYSAEETLIQSGQASGYRVLELDAVSPFGRGPLTPNGQMCRDCGGLVTQERVQTSTPISAQASRRRR
jgi:hypothetical protein